jgi:hypothetical protein
MSLADAELLELHALCSALVDQTIDQSGRRRLNAMLAASEEARRFYVRNKALSASLHDYAGELQSDEPDRVVHVHGRRWIIGSLAAAAVLVAAFWLGRAITRDTSGEIAGSDDEAFVATISATTGSQWSGKGPQLGEELTQGQRLELLSGVAEVTFNSGAQVVLEGPAALDLTSAWGAVLRRGSLRASVPPEAIGFRVSNADVEVTDLGTEFSMLVGDNGGTEVFVLKGIVEANARRHPQRITLTEKQARRFDRGGVTEVRDREQKLKRWAAKAKLMHFTRPAGYVHWSFDETDGTTVRAELLGLAQNDAMEGTVLSQSPKRIAGHRGRALLCDGETLATTAIPAATKSGRTIAFWVQVPNDSPLGDAAPMITLTNGEFTTIGWNRDPGEAAVGALRTDTERGRIVGTVSLRDGQWHHIAVVIAAGGRARQYVDGRLDGATARHLKGHHSERRPRNGGATFTSALTLNIGGTPGNESSPRGFFRGAIDELFLADRALTPLEIRQLLRENKPAPLALSADVR